MLRANLKSRPAAYTDLQDLRIHLLYLTPDEPQTYKKASPPLNSNAERAGAANS